MKNIYCLLLLIIISKIPLAQNFVTTKSDATCFPPVAATAASIYVEEGDDWLANEAAALLQADVEAVTGKKPAIVHDLSNPVST